MRFIKWLIGLIIIVGILLAAAPFAVKGYLNHWFESNGYRTQIKHLGLDFIFGEVSLHGVDVRNARGEGFGVHSVDLDLDLLPLLLDGRVVISKAIIDGIQLDVRHADDQWLLAGFSREAWPLELSRGITVEIRSASLTNSEVCKSYESQCLRVESFNLTRAQIERQASGWVLSHKGPLTIQKAFLRDRSNSTTLFYGGELSVERGIYGKQGADITSARLQNVQFIENDLAAGSADTPYQTQIGELQLSSLLWQRGSGNVTLELGSIQATSIRQALQKSRDGELLLPEWVQKSLKNMRRAVKGNQLDFKLAELSARDGAIAWADHSVTPPAMTKASALRLDIGPVDSALASSPSVFNLSGKLGQDGLLKFEGEWFPFIEERKFTLSGVVESLDVSKISGYAPGLLGQGVERGEVDMAIDASAENGYVNANTRWQWTGFTIAPGRSSSGYMPLELAYDLLKDHNNSVRFSIDVSGKVDSDTIKPSYILATQARRTLSNMARGQVSATGAVSLISSNSRNQKILFEPIYYSTNARYPVQEDQVRINEMAKMLKNKPHLIMTFCAVTTGGEWAEIFNEGKAPMDGAQLQPEHRQRLLELASARGRVIRSILMDAGVASNQIAPCSHRVDMTLSGFSFTSISL